MFFTVLCDTLSVEMPSRSDIASRLPAIGTSSFEMPSLSGMVCCERGKQDEDKEFLHAQVVDNGILADDEDTDGHPIPVLILPPSPSSDGTSSERNSWDLAGLKFVPDGTSSGRISCRIEDFCATRRQPPCIPKLALAAVKAGPQSVENTPLSRQLSQPLSGRSVKSVLSTGQRSVSEFPPPMSSRSVMSLSEWYLDSRHRCNSGESTCASDSLDTVRSTTSAWFLDGHKLPDARTPATTCFKMTSAAPEYPESCD